MKNTTAFFTLITLVLFSNSLCRAELVNITNKTSQGVSVAIVSQDGVNPGNGTGIFINCKVYGWLTLQPGATGTMDKGSGRYPFYLYIQKLDGTAGNGGGGTQKQFLFNPRSFEYVCGGPLDQNGRTSIIGELKWGKKDAKGNHEYHAKPQNAAQIEQWGWKKGTFYEFQGATKNIGLN